MTLNSCVGAPVINRINGETIGVIENVYFDKIGKFFAYFLIIRPDGGEGLLKLSDAPSFTDALIIEDTPLLPVSAADSALFATNLVGMSAFTYSGRAKGKVTDASFCKNGKLNKLHTADGDIFPSQIGVIGDVILLRSQPRSSKKPRIPRPETETPVYILSEESLSPVASELSSEGDTASANSITATRPSTADYDDDRSQYGTQAPSDDSASDKKTSQTSEIRHAFAYEGAANFKNQAENNGGNSQYISDHSPVVHDDERNNENLDLDDGATTLLYKEEGAASAYGEEEGALREATPLTPPVIACAQTYPAPPAVSMNASEPMFSQGAFKALLGADAPAPDRDAGHTPTRIICDYDFLLGRTLGADLFTYTGELIAQKGAEVTARVVELARLHGKLVELTLGSIKQARD